MPDATAMVYRERSHLVAHLAASYPSTIGTDPNEPDWPVVFIDLPTGQVSWHISPSDMDLFGHVQRGDTGWDGHDVIEKYKRLDQHTSELAAARHAG